MEPILSPIVRIGGHNSVQAGPSAVAVDDAAELDAGIFDGFAVAVADSPHNGSGRGQLELEIIQRLSRFEPYDRSVRIGPSGAIHHFKVSAPASSQTIRPGIETGQRKPSLGIRCGGGCRGLSADRLQQ